jgi:hypothetical protein
MIKDNPCDDGLGLLHSLFSEAYEVPNPNDGYTLSFTSEAERLMTLERPTIEVPIWKIQCAARMPDEQAEEATQELGGFTYDAEPVRRAQLRFCRSELAALDDATARSKEVLSIWHRRMLASVGERVIGVPGERIFRVANLGHLSKQVLGFVLICVGLVFEFVNGLIVLAKADELVNEPLLYRVAFVAPYILVMFSTIVLMGVTPGPAGRRRFGNWFLAIMLTVAIVGLYLFTLKMGSLADMPDPFAADINPFPSFSLVLFFAILAGAGIAGAGKQILASGWASVAESKVVDPSDFQFNERHTEWENHRIRQTQGVAKRMRFLIDEIERDRVGFIKLCLLELHANQQDLKDAYAQVRSERLPRSINPHAVEPTTQSISSNGHPQKLPR